MKLFISLCLLIPAAATAATTYTHTWNVSTVIPDNNAVGYSTSQTVSAPGLYTIQSIIVNLTLAGGWNGDLYSYLVHDSGFTVLLNRAGRSLSNPDGSAAAGMNITFDQTALGDIHTAIAMSGGSVTGTYQPDGRITDPLNTLDTDARPAMLEDFIGLDSNGTWTLFVADRSAGETSTLQSWSMTITGVPEPSGALLGVLGAALLSLRRRR